MDEEQEELDIINNSPKGLLIREIEQRCKRAKLPIDGFLSQVLDDLLAANRSQQINLNNAIIAQVNFAEEGLLLQACGRLYAKNVDSLWDALLTMQTTFFEHEQEIIRNLDHIDPEALKKHQMETKKLEERLNRGKRKKVKLTLIESLEQIQYDLDMKLLEIDVFDLFEIGLDELEDLFVYVKPDEEIFEFDPELHTKWTKLELARKDTSDCMHDSRVVTEFNSQDIMYKPYPSYDADVDVYDMDDPTQINTKRLLLIRYNFIRHFLDLNDWCALPDDDEARIVGQLRIMFDVKYRWMSDNNIHLDTPLEEYLDRFLAFTKEFLVEEQRKMQNMPQASQKQVLRFFRALKLKEDRAHQLLEWAKQTPRKKGIFSEVTFKSIIVDPLAEDYQGPFDPYIPEEFLNPESDDEDECSQYVAGPDYTLVRRDSGIGASFNETMCTENMETTQTKEITNIPDIGQCIDLPVITPLKEIDDKELDKELIKIENDSKKSIRNIHIEESNGMLLILYQKNKFLRPKVKSKYVAMESVPYTDRRTKEKKERLSVVNFEPHVIKKRIKKEITENETESPKKRKLNDETVKATASNDIASESLDESTTLDDSANQSKPTRDSGFFESSDLQETEPLQLLPPSPASPGLFCDPIDDSGVAESEQENETEAATETTLKKSELSDLPAETLIEKKMRITRQDVALYVSRKTEERPAVVSKWQKSLAPKLNNISNKDFNINEYCSNIVNDMQVGEEKPFGDFVRGKPVSEVVRYFMSSLQLANMMNVEIIGAKPGEVSNDTFQLKLLTVESTYQKNLNTYRPDTALELSKKVKHNLNLRDMQENIQPTFTPQPLQMSQQRQYSSQKIPRPITARILNTSLNLLTPTLQRHPTQPRANLTNNKRPATNDDQTNRTSTKIRIIQTSNDAPRTQQMSPPAIVRQSQQLTAAHSRSTLAQININDWRYGVAARDQQEVDYQQPSTSRQAMD